MKRVLVSFFLLLIIGKVVAAEPRCTECIIAQIEFQEEARRMVNRLSSGDIISVDSDAKRGRSISGEGSGDRSLNSGESETDSPAHI